MRRRSNIHNEAHSILCIGNALVDVFVQEEKILPQSTQGKVLLRYLNSPVQHIEMEELIRILSGLGASADAVITSGGGAANVAKIAGLLGEKVCFTGAIGHDSNNGELADKYGHIFQKDLAAAGVELKLLLKPRPTGICLYLKTGEETRIAASPSAALDFSESDISADVIRQAKVIAVDGFMLGRRSLVRHILDLPKARGAVIAVDMGSETIAFEHAPEISDYIQQYPLILFMNKEEAAVFYKKMRNKKSEIMDKELFAFFQNLTKGREFPIITVTLGPEGAVCFSDGKIRSVKTRAIAPRESTGAGNTFCAAFLCAWLRNKPLSDCADFGNRAALLVLNTAGTQVNRSDFIDLAGELKKE